MAASLLVFIAGLAVSEPDFSTIEGTVSALYGVISGPAGEKRDWDLMRSVFAPGARLVPVVIQGGNGRSINWTVEDYIKNSGPTLEQIGFFERQVASKVERYGPVAHVWSQYEAWTGKIEGDPYDKGINSIQLSYDGKRWWVQSISWSSERQGAGKVPAADADGQS